MRSTLYHVLHAPPPILLWTCAMKIVLSHWEVTGYLVYTDIYGTDKGPYKVRMPKTKDSIPDIAYSPCACTDSTSWADCWCATSMSYALETDNTSEWMEEKIIRGRTAKAVESGSQIGPDHSF